MSAKERQKRANVSPQKSAKGRKRVQKSTKERVRVKIDKQPDLKQQGLGTPKISEVKSTFSTEKREIERERESIYGPMPV